MEAQAQERFEGWCVVELMGHNIIAGYVTEQVVGGAAMLRVDVPGVSEDRPAFTKFFAPSAVYGITPTTKENATVAAGKIRARPVELWIVPNPAPKMLAAESGSTAGNDRGSEIDNEFDGEDEEEYDHGKEW